MAWSDETPADWISSWAEDGTTVSFDLADVSPALTAAEADATDGDLRAILFSLIEHTYKYYAALATADKPTKLSIVKNSYFVSGGLAKHSYTITFDVSATEEDVVSE